MIITTVILDDEKEVYLEKLNTLDEKLASLAKDLAEATSESETFHDNPQFDYAIQEQQQTNDRRNQVNRILASRVYSLKELMKEKNDITRLGSVVELKYPNGSKMIFRIGGHATPFSDANGDSENRRRIAYDSPLGSQILGKKVGDKANLPNGAIVEIVRIF